MPDKNYRILLKGQDKTCNVEKIQASGDKYIVTFNSGSVFTYNAYNVQIIESVLSKPKPRDRFEYLKRVAETIGLTAEVEPGKTINILEYNYSKINFVSPDSILAGFLSGDLPEGNSSGTFNPVFPFGFNISQKDAVTKALYNPLSVIQGPPGTGKTQTILNIIANAVMRGESVAVVSSNNSATKNVIEKLEKYGVDFIAAYLGNNDNKRKFIKSQKPPPDISDWKIEPEAIAKLRNAWRELFGSLQEKLSHQNELSALRQELSDAETERRHFIQFASERTLSENNVSFKVENSRDALEMWLLCESYESSAAERGFIALIKRICDRLSRIGRRKRKIKKLLEINSVEQLISTYQKRFYDLKISELSGEISSMTRELESFCFSKKMAESSDISMKLFRAKLAERYAARKRETYALDDLWKKYENFIKDYPVILSTSYSLRGSLSGKVMYDYVIIDESSQVDLCTGALALSCAKKAVVVGDLKQLPNVVDSKDAAVTDSIFAEFDLPEAYRYKNHSLLSTITEMFPNAPSTLLREHYRCHPKIIEFCNKKFYNGQLIVLSEPKSAHEPLLVYKTVAGNHERTRMNQRQIDVIMEEIIPKQNLNTDDRSLGIVTPYRNQTNALQKAFDGMNVKADTVDKFQGQENEVIILSTVDNEITEFADNANRLNVAVSRAIERLIVVMSEGDARSDTNIGDLARYIEYNNFSIIDSQINSVFDYLYKSYSERRRALLVKYKRVSEYDSENLMFALISSVLQGEFFARFDVAVHVPLRMILRDMDKLSASEKQYAGNILTHVDFLIFDKIDKSPRLAVEADGAAFHAEGSRQAERDKMKDEILRKYNLPIKRFRTDGSGEREKLVAALEALSE